MDAKNPFSTFDPSLQMSDYEGFDITGINRASRDPAEFLPIDNWNDFVFDQGMGGLDTSELPPLPLLEQEQPASFLGNDHALPLYNAGTQFPFPNQDPTDAVQVSLPSNPQEEITGGSVGNTNSDTALPTPKKRKPRKKKNPPSEKEREEKHHRFLDRNRKAAQKCREKKKGWVESLQTKYATLQRDHEMLRFEREQMTKELELCKQLLAQHTACGVSMNSLASMSHNGTVSMDRNMSSQSRFSTPMDRNMSSRASIAMDRSSSSSSSQSHMSQNSSSSLQKDSGISNMGTPPYDRRNVKQFHDDEGFSGTLQSRQGQHYAAEPKVSMLHGGMVGPSDLQNPAEFLARMGVHRPM